MTVLSQQRHPKGSALGGQWQSTSPPDDVLPKELTLQTAGSAGKQATIKLFGKQRTLRRQDTRWGNSTIFHQDRFEQLLDLMKDYRPSMATPVEIAAQVITDMLNAGDITLDQEQLDAAAKAATYGFFEGRKDDLSHDVRSSSDLRQVHHVNTQAIEIAAVCHARSYALRCHQPESMLPIPEWTLNDILSSRHSRYLLNPKACGPTYLGDDHRLLHRLLEEREGTSTPLWEHLRHGPHTHATLAASFWMGLYLIGSSAIGSPSFGRGCDLLNDALTKGRNNQDMTRNINEFLEHLHLTTAAPIDGSLFKHVGAILRQISHHADEPWNRFVAQCSLGYVTATTSRMR